MSLQLEFETCAYSLFVNGGLVAMNMEAMAANEQHPVNHLLRRGENVVELRLLVNPTAEEWPETQAVLSMTVADLDADIGPTVTLMKTRFVGTVEGPGSIAGSSPAGRFDSGRGMTPSTTGDVEVSAPTLTALPFYGEVSIRRTIRLPMPYREWEFLRSDLVPEAHDIGIDGNLRLYHQILDAYQPIWSALQRRDVPSILPMFEERSRETDEALFLAPGSTQRRLAQMLQESVDDPDLALAPASPPPGRTFTLIVGGASRLATIVRTNRGSPVIKFLRKDAPGPGTSARIFPISWRFKNGKLFVAR